MTTRRCNMLDASDQLTLESKANSHRLHAHVAARFSFVPRALARLLRVLVVDNDRDTTDTLAMVVKLWGHNVGSAYDGEGALRAASKVRPDVILLDVAMPRVDGCDVARTLRGQRRFDQTRIIAVSGYAEQLHREKCCEAGFDAFLAKPFGMKALEDLLATERDRIQRRLLHTRSASFTGRYSTDDLSRITPADGCRIVRRSLAASL